MTLLLNLKKERGDVKWESPKIKVEKKLRKAAKVVKVKERLAK